MVLQLFQGSTWIFTWCMEGKPGTAPNQPGLLSWKKIFSGETLFALKHYPQILKDHFIIIDYSSLIHPNNHLPNPHPWLFQRDSTSGSTLHCSLTPKSGGPWCFQEVEASIKEPDGPVLTPELQESVLTLFGISLAFSF
jgi:hypothetical protein